MNRSNLMQKRSVARSQPKRPKLDFSAKSMFSSHTNAKDPDQGYEINTRNSTNLDTENKIVENGANASDWDDEFPSDMLEKVCLIADLSQAMVNKEAKDVESLDGIQKQGCKRTIYERDNLGNSSKMFEELEGLKLENEKLKEIIKTKEGEIQIIRSQLKQNQEAKQAETLNNIKLVEDMQQSFKDKIEATQKEFDAAKTELQFKDLELKSLTERCKQLESNTSKIKLVEPQAVQWDCGKSFNLTQTSIKARVKGNDVTSLKHQVKEEPFNFLLTDQSLHEGQKFKRIICPEFFNFIEEPSIIPFYTYHRAFDFHVSSLDFDKREKYKWSGLPKQTVFIKDTFKSVTGLFLSENFIEESAKMMIENLLNISTNILTFQKNLFSFLEHLQEKNNDFDDSDRSLLEDEEQVNIITIKNLLDGKKINKEECSIEARRVLALVVSLMRSSKSVVRMLIKKSDFILLLKDLATSIGNLRRPTRYSGILVGITFVLSQFLCEKDINKDFIPILNEIAEEIIFTRPKLDVLREVVEVLAVAKNHLDFVQALCRKGSVESCALYMDSKLQQAMFFTKDACPLKLLCTQIMGLSCISVNREMKWNLTRSIIKWLNCTMDTTFSNEIKWLPNGYLSENEDRCFDVVECFVFLLNSCLKDYLLFFNWNIDEEHEVNFRTPEKLKIALNLISIIGDGSVLLRRILKSDHRLLYENSYNVRFATQLKNVKVHSSLHFNQREAINWIIEMEENDLKNQEGCDKQNISGFTDIDVIDNLRINDNLIIF